MPIILDEKPESMQWLLELIDVGVILHNFIQKENLNDDTPYFYSGPPPVRKRHHPNKFDDISQEDKLNTRTQLGGGARREQLRTYLSESALI